MSTEEAGPTEIYGIYLSGKRTVRRTIVFSALFFVVFCSLWAHPVVGAFCSNPYVLFVQRGTSHKAPPRAASHI